jgi:hypothetical protein
MVATVAVRMGELREMKRLDRDGRPVVILVDPESENLYRVGDPQLGAAEPGLVDALLEALGRVC